MQKIHDCNNMESESSTQKLKTSASLFQFYGQGSLM